MNTPKSLFAGAAAPIIEFLVKNMEADPVSTRPDVVIHKSKMIALITGIVRVMVWLRDEGASELSVREIRECLLDLNRIIDWTDPSKFPEMPNNVRSSIKTYVDALPGYRKELGYKQPPSVWNFHGYFQLILWTTLFSAGDHSETSAWDTANGNVTPFLRDVAMYDPRTKVMFTGVMRALMWLRKESMIDLSKQEIRDHLDLKRVIDLGDALLFPDMPADIRLTIKSYLSSLPNFHEEKGYKQSLSTFGDHGFVKMEIELILNDSRN